MLVLPKKEVDEINDYLDKIYSCGNIFEGYVVLHTGRENKVWLAHRDVFDLNYKEMHVVAVGLYFGRFDRSKFRLSVEGAGIVGKSAKRNILEVDEANFWYFVRGFDLAVTGSSPDIDEREYIIISHKGDYLGVAFKDKDNLVNGLPKSRKIHSTQGAPGEVIGEIESDSEIHSEE